MAIQVKDFLKSGTNSVNIDRDATTKEAIAKMIEKRCNYLIVTDHGGDYLGILSSSTIMRMHYHTGRPVLELLVHHHMEHRTPMMPHDDAFEMLDRFQQEDVIVVTEGKKVNVPSSV